MFHFSLCMELGSCPDRHTKRKRDTEAQKDRGREGAGEREKCGGGGGVTERMTGVEREGRRGQQKNKNRSA